MVRAVIVQLIQIMSQYSNKYIYREYPFSSHFLVVRNGELQLRISLGGSFSRPDVFCRLGAIECRNQLLTALGVGR